MNIQSKPTHSMEIMDPSGHTTVTWNPDEPASVEAGRREFQRLIRQGYHAHRLNIIMENGVIVEEKGDRITSFDPHAGKVIMFPQLAGG